MLKEDLLWSWYCRELDRSDSLYNSLSLPTGILTGMVVAFYSVLGEIKSLLIESKVTCLMHVIIGVSIVFWVVSAYNIIMGYSKAHRGYEYRYLNSPKILDDYFAKLKVHNSEEADKNFSEFLIDCLKKSIDENKANNDTKSRYIHMAKTFLVFAITSLALAVFILIFYNFL